MYDRILLPTDGSQGVARAIDQAIGLADLTGGTVYALSAYGNGGLDEAAAEEAVATVAERGGEAGVEVETAVVEGPAFRTIVDWARDLGADVVVMGTHGRSGVDRFLLGSVTERVVRSLDVPVVTVPLSDRLAVGSEAAAIEAASEALTAEGFEFADTLESPYREPNTWVVPCRATDGTRFNVHVEAATGESRVARLGGE